MRSYFQSRATARGREVRRRLVPVALLLALIAVTGSQSTRAATSTAVVSATVTTATSLDASGCASNTTPTNFGSLLPSSSNVTASDCSVIFGSSNNSAMLQIAQSDGAGTALAQPLPSWPWVGGPRDAQFIAMKPGTPSSAVVFQPVSGGSYTQATTNTGTGWSQGAIVGMGPSGAAWEPGTSDVWASDWGVGVDESTDGGVNWTLGVASFPGHAMSIASPATGLVYAVDDTGVVKRWNGTVWATIETLPAGDYSPDCLVAPSASTVYVCSDTAIYKSTNANTGSPTFSLLYTFAGVDGITNLQIAPNGTDLYVLTAPTSHSRPDTIYRSTNSGASFSVVYTSPEYLFSSLSVAGNNAIYAAGDNGTLLFSSNGTSWVQQTSVPTTNDISTVEVSGTNGYATTNSSGVLVTTDGSTWTQKGASLGYVESYTKVSAGNGAAAWAIGGNGLIAKSTNMGISWTPQTSGTAHHLRGVSAHTSTFAVAVGDAGTITRTTDGTNWATVASGTANNLWDVSMADTNCGFAVGDSGTVLYTSNGGASWTNVSTGAGTWFTVSTVDCNTAWIAGQGGAISKTTNAGLSWTSETTGETNAITSISAADSQYVWATSANDGNGAELSSTNGGTSWSISPSGNLNPILIRAVDRNNLYGVVNDIYNSGYGQRVVQSTDGGATWNVVAYNGDRWNDVAGISAYAAIAVGDGQQTNNAGATINPVADFAAGSADWSTGANMFGVCLNSVANGASTSAGPSPAATWQANAGCPMSGSWYAIPTTNAAATAKIAQSTVLGTLTAQANLRFGFKTSAGQAPGAYIAPITFDVAAPNV